MLLPIGPILPGKVLNNHRMTLLISKTSRTLFKEIPLIIPIMPNKMGLLLNIGILNPNMNILNSVQEILVLPELAILQLPGLLPPSLAKIKEPNLLRDGLIEPPACQPVSVVTEL